MFDSHGQGELQGSRCAVIGRHVTCKYDVCTYSNSIIHIQGE